jgi:hypothetical protein
MADFFEKLTENLDRGIKTVSAKGKQFLETHKLNSDLSEVRNRIRVKYQRLGEKVYEMNNRGETPPEELKPEMEAISGDYKLVAEIEAAIKEAEAKAAAEIEGQTPPACSKCNASNLKGARFCAKCGEPIEVAEPEVKAEVCGQCGQAVKEEFNYCPKCGTQLKI